jgi:hypothetical protein
VPRDDDAVLDDPGRTIVLVTMRQQKPAWPCRRARRYFTGAAFRGAPEVGDAGEAAEPSEPYVFDR